MKGLLHASRFNKGTLAPAEPVAGWGERETIEKARRMFVSDATMVGPGARQQWARVLPRGGSEGQVAGSCC